MISAQWSVIYNPKFLNRLLQILYKISLQNIKILVDCIKSSQCIYSLIKLIKYCSTPEKLLSAKILCNICIKTDKDNLEEVLDLYYDDYGKKFNNFLELLIDNVYLIRKKCWNSTEINSTGNYVLSNYLIKIIRELIYNNSYSEEINNLINNLNLSSCKTTDDFIKKEIILSAIGSDFFGQAIGSRVKVPNPLSNISSNFDFTQKNEEIKPITGTIIGFSKNMNELFGITESNSKNLETFNNNSFYNIPNNLNDNVIKKDVKGEINLTPNNDFENKVGILLDNSITNKSNFNVQELFPKVFDQCKVMPIIDYINYENIKIDQNTIDCLIDFLEKNIPTNYNKNEIKESELLIKQNENNIINLCTNIIRFLYSFFEYNSNKIGNKLEINISPK